MNRIDEEIKKQILTEFAEEIKLLLKNGGKGWNDTHGDFIYAEIRDYQIDELLAKQCNKSISDIKERKTNI